MSMVLGLAWAILKLKMDQLTMEVLTRDFQMELELWGFRTVHDMKENLCRDGSMVMVCSVLLMGWSLKENSGKINNTTNNLWQILVFVEEEECGDMDYWHTLMEVLVLKDSSRSPSSRKKDARKQSREPGEWLCWPEGVQRSSKLLVTSKFH